jgi:hypothetical protein
MFAPSMAHPIRSDVAAMCFNIESASRYPAGLPLRLALQAKDLMLDSFDMAERSIPRMGCDRQHRYA